MKRLLLALTCAGLLVACSSKVTPEQAVSEARKLLDQGRTGEARIMLKNALSSQSQLPGARALLAQMALDEGDAKAAADELSVAGDTDDPEVVALQVRIALAQGRGADADKLLNDAGQRLPESERVLLRAAVLRRAGSYGEALLLLRNAQTNAADPERVVVEIADLLAATGNIAAAVATVDHYLEGAKDGRANALQMRAMLRLRQGSPESAYADLQAALQAAPASWPVSRRLATRLMQAEVLLSMGKFDEVRQHLDSLAKERPGMQGAEIIAARLDLMEGKPGAARNRLAPIVDAAPGNVVVENLLMDALIKSGNRVQAVALLEQRVKKDPLDLAARQTLASLMMQQGRPDRVVELLGEVDGPELLRTRGLGELIDLARRTVSKATADIKRLTEESSRKPQDEEIRVQLAEAQLAQGDARAAIRTLDGLKSTQLTARVAAARLAALLATENKRDSNLLVDQLLKPNGGIEAEVLLAAAASAYRHQELSIAGRLLDRAASLKPQQPEIALRRASVAFDEGRFDKARELLEPLAESANLPAAQFALARVLEEDGDIDGARTALKKAVKSSPGKSEPALMLAALEQRAGRPREAQAAVDALIANDTDGTAMHSAGLVAFRANRFDEARTRFRQAVDRAPGNAAFWFNLGQAQLALADKPAAKESFQKAVSLQPDSPQAAVAAVKLSVDQKDEQGAEQAAKGFLSAAPQSFLAWELEAQVALLRRDAKRAQLAFEKSYMLKPAAGSAVGAFRVRLMQNDSAAHQWLIRWLAVNPNDFAVRSLLAEYLLGRGAQAEAQAQFEILLKQSPNEVVALNNLAWLLKDKDPARAEQLARSASAIAPQNAAIADTLGMILLSRKKTAEAVGVLKAAADSPPQNGTILFHYAQALQASGQREQARGVLDIALAGNAPFEGRDAAQRLAAELK
jgi:cellulose synthase operon protein C